MGLGIEVEAGVVSEEAGVVEEMAGVISTKASRGAKMVVLAMVSKTSLEVPIVIMVKPDSKLKISAKQAQEAKASVANPDAWGRLIGPQNIAPIKIDGEETMVLLDGGAQISTISKKWVQEANLPIYELENLVEIIQAGIIYSGILKGNDKLPTSWKFIKDDVEFKKKLEGQPDKPIGFAKMSKVEKIAPNESRILHYLTKAKCHGMSVNVLVEPSEVPKLPPGLECQYSYSDIIKGSSKIAVSIRNVTDRTITLPKGTRVGEIYTANRIPKILNQAVKISKLKTDVENACDSDNANPSNGSSTNPNSDSTKSTETSSSPVDWVLEKLDLSGMKDWPLDLQAKAKALLVSYSDIFSKDELDLGTTNLTKHDIKLTDNTPFKAKYRRIPPHLYEEVRAHLKEMIDLGAIKKSQSPWSSPIVLVRKKDGKLRFCIDLGKLNQRTVRDNYSLPRIDHMLELLIGAEWFCTLDLKSGYWQVELTDEAKPLTAFTCGPLGFYECEKMPFGASNAPATFQRLMENYLGDLNLRWCVVYLDDIIVYGKSPEEILERLGAVFEKLRKAGLKLKPSKCEFFKEQIQFLDHIVSKEGISTCPEKVHAVQEWPAPKTINDLRSFLGFVGYYRKFIKGLVRLLNL